MSESIPQHLAVAEFDDALTIARRTYRSGDVVHLLMGGLATVFALIVVWIRVTHGTLTSGSTLYVVGALAVYGYFAATKAFNRRTMTFDGVTLKVKDGPLWSPFRRVDERAEYALPLSYKKRTSFTPMLTRDETWTVRTDGGFVVMSKLPFEEEAEFITISVNERGR